MVITGLGVPVVAGGVAVGANVVGDAAGVTVVVGEGLALAPAVGPGVGVPVDDGLGTLVAMAVGKTAVVCAPVGAAEALAMATGGDGCAVTGPHALTRNTATNDIAPSREVVIRSLPFLTVGRLCRRYRYFTPQLVAAA